MTNPNPNQVTTNNQVIPISEAPPIPGVPNSAINPSAYLPGAVLALGARTTPVNSFFNLDLLRDACSNLGLVANTSHSSGCSPVLKELIKESGLVYAVSREIYDDGDTNGHKNGNAIDLIGETIDLEHIARMLREMPELFSIVIFPNAEFEDETLYIYDGELTTASTFPAQVADQIHIASSLARMSAGFLVTSVREALGGEAWTVPQFTNRDVYVIPDNTGGGAPNVQGVNFW